METIKFSRAEIAMLFELASKAAAIGSEAATLGALYSKIKAANDRANPAKVPSGGPHQ